MNRKMITKLHAIALSKCTSTLTHEHTPTPPHTTQHKTHVYVQSIMFCVNVILEYIINIGTS